VKGTNRGTVTNSNGEFSIDVTRGETLVVSSVGFKSQEFVIGSGDQDLSIRLTQSEVQISEVVVTALGIRKEARRLGYATGKVNGDELTQAREINLGNALAGKVAGVNATAPATGPGGSSRVTIRGNTTLGGQNQPLYVINGIPVDNQNMGSAGMWGGADLGDALTVINPDDIQEITVLKGGAAAALYGTRGKSGVILITTKTGRVSKNLGIEFNSNVQIDKIHNYTDFQTVYGQGTLGAKPIATNASSTIFSAWGAPLDGSQVVGFDGKMYPYSAQGDNLARFYETGTTFNNSIALSGGSEAATFRFSFGDLRNKSVYPHSKYTRNTANLDLTYKLSPKWSGNANMIYSREIGDNRTNLSDAPGNGNWAIMFLAPNVNAEYLKPGYDDLGNEIVLNDQNKFATNPYFAASKFQNDTRRNRLLGVASIRYSPLSWLYIQGRATNDYYSFSATQITPTGTAYNPGGGVNNESTSTFNELNLDAMVGVNRNYKDFTFNGTLGANLLKQESRNLTTNASGLAFPNLYNPGFAVNRGVNLSTPEKEIHSVYGSFEFGYRNTFYLNVTDRIDWSSTLPPDKNSYNYPSVTGSYVFTEHFKPSWLSFGKLRAAYAMVGGDAPISSRELYYGTGAAINGILTGSMGSTIPNSEIEPLKVKEYEIGTELKFFNNRLFADFAWYNKQTLNDIVAQTVSRTSGYASAYVNIGKLENKGIEIMVGGVPLQLKDLKWTSTFNYAHNKNLVVSLAEGQTFVDMDQSRTQRAFIQNIVGLPYSQVMVYDFARNNKGELILNASGFPTSSSTLIPAGTGIHPITGGWNNNLAYKNFSLDFLIDFKYGAVIHSGTNAQAMAAGLHKVTLNYRGTDSITVTGVTAAGAPMTKKLSSQQYYGALSSISINHVYDADFIKFRSLTLSYNFPAKVFNNKVQGLTISLVGRNLFYIKKNTENIDPESVYNTGNAQGLEYLGLPTTRSLGVNLNVKF